MRTRLFTLFLYLLSTVFVSAQTFKVDGIKYEITSLINNEVEVAGCDAAEQITIPSTVEFIGMQFAVKSIGEMAFALNSTLSSLVLSEGLTTIGTGAFSWCSSLSSIVLPESVTSIGNRAFELCSSLSSVVLPKNLKSIGEYAFSDCTSLSSVTFSSSSSLTSIGNGAFYYCRSLSSIVLPEGLTTIGDYAFLGCSALSSVTFPKNLVSVGDYAFNDCNSLLTVDFFEGLTSIGSNAFYSCTSLSSINLPDGLTSIGNGAFWGCSALSSIYSNAVTPPETNSVDTFDGIDNDIPVYVPQESLEAYKTASGWSYFTNFQGMTTSVDQSERQGGLSISNGKLHNAEGLLIEIDDMNGRQVYRGTDTTVSLPSGVYVVRSKSSAFKIAL